MLLHLQDAAALAVGLSVCSVAEPGRTAMHCRCAACFHMGSVNIRPLKIIRQHVLYMYSLCDSTGMLLILSHQARMLQHLVLGGV
jgi:hypothetical protein